MAHLADVYESFPLGTDVDEGTKILEAGDGAGVDLSLFQVAPIHRQGLHHGDHYLVLLRVNFLDPYFDLVANTERV